MAGTSSITTENFCRLNFTPKSGITPGTNDTLAMSCDQIITRYKVTVSGVTTTGNRLPAQNQLTALVTPTYASCSQDFAGTGVPKNFSNSMQIGTTTGTQTFAKNYAGSSTTSWKSIVITGFNADLEADGYSLWTLKDGSTQISSFPYTKAVTGIADGGYPGITVSYADPTGRYQTLTQRCRITYYMIDTNNELGASATITTGAAKL